MLIKAAPLYFSVFDTAHRVMSIQPSVENTDCIDFLMTMMMSFSCKYTLYSHVHEFTSLTFNE